MPQNKLPDDAKDQAIVAVVNWRAADKISIADKGNAEAQRAEYYQRKCLRFAADKLNAEAKNV